MNTLRDTDKRRARPSVWPVYLAAAIIVAVGVWVIYPFIGPYVFFHPRTEWADLLRSPLGLVVAWVLLGFVAAVGLVGLRPWARWYAALFAVTCTAWGGLGLSDAIVVSVFAPELAWPTADYIIEITPWLAVAVLLVVVLVTRRQLFFPPKQESEE